jgi:hypothetical protein
VHSDRAEIDAAIVERRGSYRDVARQWRVSKDAVARHAAEHIPAALAVAAEVSASVEAVTLLGRIGEVERRARSLLGHAEARVGRPDATSKDVAACAVALRELRQTVELLGRADGSLVERQRHEHAHVHVVAPPSPEDEARSRDDVCRIIARDVRAGFVPPAELIAAVRGLVLPPPAAASDAESAHYPEAAP